MRGKRHNAFAGINGTRNSNTNPGNLASFNAGFLNQDFNVSNHILDSLESFGTGQSRQTAVGKNAALAISNDHGNFRTADINADGCFHGVSTKNLNTNTHALVRYLRYLMYL